MEQQFLDLQKRFKAEQQKSKEAEARAKEEQRLREEEQRLREEEQQKSKQAEARAQEERRLREAAEAESQPKNLIEYLEACHGFSLALEVITDQSLSTKGDATVPAGRPFPQRIVPWDDFPAQQEKIWEKLSVSTDFNLQRVFPSAHQLDYVRTYLDPIASEVALRHFARETVENPVRTLIQAIHKHEQLRNQLQLQGTMEFESHTNLTRSLELPMENEMAHLSISEPNTSRVARSRAKGKDKQVGGQHNTKATSWRKRVGSADQFCIMEQTNGQTVPFVSIEYKAPHKFPLAQIIAGLSGEIRPSEEIINKEGDDFEFLSKSLVAAVITQLFSYMIAKGVQHGYIFDGEAIIFLYIPNDDPSTVFYHLAIPRLDFQDDDENRLHRTGVAQILAFILIAHGAEPPGQSWHDAAAVLETWAVEYIDILKKIPETERKASRFSPYNASRWKGFKRSPIKTRSRVLAATCSKPVNDQPRERSDEDDDTPPTPTPNRTTRPRIGQGKAKSGKQQRTSRQSKSNSTGQEVEEVSTIRIGDRPYCTQKCLHGLAFGGALDEQCPNLRDHGNRHIRKSTFLRLIYTQLARDRSNKADCKPLYVKGARGAIFKIRLSSHGYTLVAKGMEEHDIDYLAQERKVYNHLSSLQGECIPVCLGTSNLKLPYYYDCGVYVTMLFLSWAGRPLHQYINPANENGVIERATSALKGLHSLQVLHNDAEPRNMLWDEHRNKFMLVDLERAEIYLERAEIPTRLPLGNISANRKRNRQGDIKAVPKEDVFDREIREMISCIHTMASPSYPW
ncbi:hypothetical protein V491_01494 [Pseudogymnoascus sp. VKM F-3775]|nr:hypothetical protein V491_01494 [Pseudogymnoascus sp. VKM F-3775]